MQFTQQIYNQWSQKVLIKVNLGFVNEFENVSVVRLYCLAVQDLR